MSAVISYTHKLTGRTRIVPGWLGPRLEVEVIRDGFDTNTGILEPTRIFWRKATNSDLACPLATPTTEPRHDP